MSVRRGVGIALAVLVSACGAAPHVVRPGTLSGRARLGPTSQSGLTCAELQPTEGARVCAIAHVDVAAGTLHVRLRIDPEALPGDRVDVRLAFRDAYFGEGYAADFVRLDSGDPWPGSIGRVEAPYEISYEVSLDLAERGQPPLGLAGISWRRADGLHLTGKSFLPDVLVDGQAVAVPAILSLDSGDEPLFTAAGTDQRIFEAPSLIRLADEGYEVGPLTITRRQIGNTTLWLGASGDVADARVEALADGLADAMRVIEARLGPPPTDSLLFTFHQVEGFDPNWGERLGSSLVQAYEGPLVVDTHHGDVARAIHELVHLWNPGSHLIREDWFDEGLTDFLTTDVVATLTEAPLDAQARTWLRAHERYAAVVGDGTLRDTHPEASRFSYDSGMVTGFCLDAHLRQSGSSLAAVLQRTLEREEEELGPAILMEDLAQVSPEAASYLEALAMTRGPFAIDDCMERAGFRIQEETFSGYDEHTVAMEILGAPGTRAMNKRQALEVSSVTDGSPLEVGDVIERVQGHPVASLLDVAYAIRDVHVGDPFEIQVRRGGEPQTLEQPMPALEGLEALEQTYVVLTPTDREPT